MKALHTGLVVAALTLGSFVAISANAGNRGGWEGRGDHVKAMDTDGNGTLTRAEVDAFALAKAAEMDMNKDGAVTVAEMKAHREAQRAKREADRLARMDTNKDGKVSVDEIAEMRSGWFMKRDADGNGELSTEELSHRGHHGKRGHH